MDSGQMYASALEMNGPALHKFPAASQIGIDWSKAMGVNPDSKSCKKTRRQLAELCD